MSEEKNISTNEAAPIKNREEREKESKRRGWIVSISIHAILLLILLWMGLYSQTPPPGEEGILVNFGHAESGFGDEAPTSPEEVVQEEPVESSETPVTEEVTTLDNVDAPSIKQEKTKTEPTKEPEKEEPKVDPNALFNPSKIKKDGSGQGNKEGKDDMGAPDGDPNSSVYGPKSYGKGTKGTGWDLEGSGRKLLRSPEIDDISQETGKVVIRVKVDKNGRVVGAEFIQKGSTTTNSYLVAKAIKAAKEARFNPSSKQKGLATGHFTFNFKVK